MAVDHNDFQLLERRLQDLDDEQVAGIGVDLIVGQHADPDSVGAIAANRALRIVGSEPIETVEDIATIAAATWLEGFVVGARFRQGEE